MDLEKLLVLLFLAYSSCSLALNPKRGRRRNESEGEIQKAMEYLSKYGYFGRDVLNGSQTSLRDLRKPVKEFQRLMGLPVTGKLNDETLKIMSTPRCSNKDNFDNRHSRKKNNSTKPQKYVLYGTKWGKEVVTYRVTRYSQQRVTAEFVDSQIREAFSLWELHANLWFTETDDEAEADIEIQFTRGSHGDNFPFPPDSSQLAHAFYPPNSGLGGDIHFNDDVDWTQKNMLLYTALHEIGHSIGLRHSSNQKSIMYSHLILDTKSGVSLDTDDIEGMQALYGRRDSAPAAPTTKRPPPPRGSTTTATPQVVKTLRNHGICEDGRFDAATALPNDNILVFRGEELITLKLNMGLELLSIRKIRTAFNNRLPSDIDAAFTNRQNKTYFFKGNLYWRSTGFVMDDGYPKLIERNFPGIPGDIDAAFEGPHNNIYFFKGTKFWKFNPKSKKHGYEFQISRNWGSIPADGIEAIVFMPDRKSYFFRNGRYWKFDHFSNNVILNPCLFLTMSLPLDESILDGVPDFVWGNCNG